MGVMLAGDVRLHATSLALIGERAIGAVAGLTCDDEGVEARERGRSRNPALRLCSLYLAGLCLTRFACALMIWATAQPLTRLPAQFLSLVVEKDAAHQSSSHNPFVNGANGTERIGAMGKMHKPAFAGLIGNPMQVPLTEA
jgi:hypothetical protein